MTIRCAVFDFDGTLVDSNEIKHRGFFEVAAEFDPEGEIVAAVLDRAAGDRHDIARDLAETLVERGQSAGRQPAELAKWLVEEFTRYCQREVSACNEIGGASAALGALAERGLLLFVNSATPLDALLPILRARGLESRFAGVYGRPRSKLENLAEIGEQAGAKPGEVVVVGDGEDDRELARDFGCHFVAVAPPGSDRFRATPQYAIPDLSDLPRVIVELDGSAP